MAPKSDLNLHPVRVQESLLAPAEKACLEWLAKGMPGWVTPDHLTLLGFSGMLFAGVSYGLARWWPSCLLLVNFWIAVNWFGDSLDGTLARVRDKQRPRYGYYIDHVVDTIGSLLMMAGLAFSGYMTPILAIGMLVAFYMLSINLYLAAYSLGVFKLSFWKFGPTEIRVLLATGNLVAFDRRVVGLFGEQHLFFDVGGAIAITSMLVVFIISVVANTVTLYRSERV